MNRSRLGARGEEFATRYLRENGYRILGQNVRARLGEIDVIARDGTTLCFVEVKARSDPAFGLPEERVDFHKQKRLVRLASWYLQTRRLHDVPVRFDVVSVLTNNGSFVRARLIKGAFEAD